MVRPGAIKLRYWVPVFIWMLAIFGLSSVPGKDIPRIGPEGLDKIAHAAEYGILGFLLVRAFVMSGASAGILNINLAGTIILSIIIAAAYAALDEWHQGFVPGREMDIFDLAADFAGLGIGVFLYKKRG